MLVKLVGAALVVLFIFSGTKVEADGSNHKYKERDHVPLYANKVGLFHNPSLEYWNLMVMILLAELLKNPEIAVGAATICR
ncbi:transmembrane 9 superfamily member 4-like isoform X2 [Magnolia sinica]|uniref:transmembrane 9 superfamily member 4-like isoform X2 n=1 Tax=Magnolia sinica TaxID=86752 RepID=UPI002658A123|nr:transmembrane 9 superfamily member 4-like isoform X2 [Magnolia sinica]